MALNPEHLFCGVLQNPVLILALPSWWRQAIERHSGLLFCQLLRLALAPDQANSIVDDGIDFFTNSFSRFLVRRLWDSVIGAGCRPKRCDLTPPFDVLVKLFKVIRWQFIKCCFPWLMNCHRMTLNSFTSTSNGGVRSHRFGRQPAPITLSQSRRTKNRLKLFVKKSMPSSTML